jgi:YbbR domain-containing protein
MARERWIDGVGGAFTHNLPLKLVSLLVALILWVVVLGSRDVEVSKEVPIEVITSPDLVIANEVPEKITFRLSGPKAFLRAVLDRREDPIQVNLVGARAGLLTHRFFSDNIRVPIGVKVLSLSPSSLAVKLEAVKTKTIPIRLTTRGELNEGLKIRSMAVLPESVRVTGPESRIEPLQEAPTAPLDLSTLRGSVDREIPLEPPGTGLQYAGPAPRARIEIEGLGANFKIRNIAIRVSTPLKFRIQPATVTAMVRAAPADLRKLDRSRIFAKVDLEGRPRGTYSEPVQIELPPNVTLVRVVPETVNLTLY